MIYHIINLSFEKPLNKDDKERLISYCQSIGKKIDYEANIALKTSKNISAIPILRNFYKEVNTLMEADAFKTFSIIKYIVMNKVNDTEYEFGYPFDNRIQIINERGMEFELRKKFKGIKITKKKEDIDVSKIKK